MDDFAIAVFSCDADDDLWPIFHHCLNKYWPKHPKVYVLTESKKCTYYKTISENYSLDKWSVRIRESLKQIPENKLLLICDDCFINKKVKINKLKKALKILDSENTANVNFEVFNDYGDEECAYPGFRKKNPEASSTVVSFLCGVWNKDVLIELLSVADSDPWTLEFMQEQKGYNYYQCADSKIISWFRDGYGENAAVRRGKWMPNTKLFFEKEHIKIDLNKRGVWTEDFWDNVLILEEKYKRVMKQITQLTKEKESVEKAIGTLWKIEQGRQRKNKSN